MLDEFKKSISSSLYERVTSPLYGCFILSWLIWNWKIAYLTFFISEKSISKDKIVYIVENYSDIHNLLTYPLISTLLLLTIVPFIANGAFWLNLRFNKWKIDKKHEIEKSQLLTLEQSIELRAEIANKEKLFESMLSGKSAEIDGLKLQLRTAIESKAMEKSSLPKGVKQKASENNTENEFKLFLESGKLNSFIQYKDKILKDNVFAHKGIDGIENAMAFGLIEPQGSAAKLTQKGKDFLKWLILNPA